jgi:hypothetical protein
MGMDEERDRAAAAEVTDDETEASDCAPSASLSLSMTVG